MEQNLSRVQPWQVRFPLLVIATIFYASALATSAATNLFSTSFEASEGYKTGIDLVGQNGWLGAGNGGDGIVTNFFANQVQNAFIGFRPPVSAGDFHAVGHSVNFDPSASGMPLVTFSTVMAVYASTTNHQGWFDWAVFNADGKLLFSLEFPSGSGAQSVFYKLGTGDYQNTGQTFTNALAYTLTVRMDFASNLWSATLDSKPLATNQPITTSTNRLTLGNIDAQWALFDGHAPGNEFMVFDEFHLSAEPLPTVAEMVLYSTSFESSEGFQFDQKLVGQNGWLGSGDGGDGFVSNFFDGQLQTAFLGFKAPTESGDFHAVGYPVNYRPGDRGLSNLTFSVDMAVHASTTNRSGWFDWAFFNSDGKRLLSFEFPAGDGDHPVYYLIGDSDYQDSGITYTNAVPYRFTLSMNFAANRWYATLDSRVVATNQPITTTNLTLSLESIDAQWQLRDGTLPGDEFMVFDEFRVVASKPASTTPPGSRPSLQMNRPNAGKPVLRVTGDSSANYALEASSDLRTWTSLGFVTTTNGVVEYLDPNITQFTNRFYRARTF